MQELICNCGKPLLFKEFLQCIIYYCDSCNYYKYSPIQCDHKHTHPVKIILSNKAIQIRLFCDDCKILLPKALKQSDYDLSKLESRLMSDYYDYTLKENQKVSEFLKLLKTDNYHNSFIEDYIQYINSPEWREKRLLALERDNYICQICGVPAKEVHHLTYEHFKNEYIFELVSLCLNCHKTKYKSIFK